MREWGFIEDTKQPGASVSFGKQCSGEMWVFVFLALQDETYPEIHPETYPETCPRNMPAKHAAKHTRETYPRNISQNQSDVASNDAVGSNGLV